MSDNRHPSSPRPPAPDNAREQVTVDFPQRAEPGVPAAPGPALDRRALPPEVAGLVEQMQELQLLTAPQLAEASQAFAPSADRETWLHTLQQRGLLTAYQVEHLRSGKSKQLVFGAYHLLEPLGKGGMGQVFKARHRVMKRLVALKIIRKGHLPPGEAIKRFQQEIETAAKVSHPNIVTTHDAGRAGDFHFVVMELIEGVSLDALLKQRGPLPIAEACDLARQAALGLHHAHEQGLVHRDIKPHNMMVSSTAHVKILDMGLARVRYDPAGGGQAALTKLGTVMGTPDYIAPEQILDCSRVDGRADIYGLGCVLYQLLSGQLPCPGKSMQQKLEQHTSGTPRPVQELRPEVPAKLAAIVQKMLARKPGERYQTGAEVAAALADFCSKEALAGVAGIQARLEPPLQLTPQPQLELQPMAELELAEPARPPLRSTLVALWRRRPWSLTAAAVLCLLLLVTALIFMLRDGSTNSPAREGEDVIAGPLGKHKAGAISASLRKGLPLEVVAVLGDGRPRHKGSITALTVSPDGRWFASTDAAAICLCDAKTLEVVHELPKGQWAAKLAFSLDSRRLAGGNPLRVYDVRSGKQLWQCPDEKVSYAVGFTPEGLLVTASTEGLLRVWDANADKLVREWKGSHNESANAALHGSSLLWTAADESLWLWDVTQEKPQSWREKAGKIYRSALSSDGKLAATGDIQGTVTLWDAVKGERLHTLSSGSFGAGWGVTSIFFLPPDEKHLLVNQTGSVFIWDLATRQVIGKAGGGSYVDLLDGGKQLLASDQKTVRLYETTTGKELLRSAPSNADIGSLAFTPDGKRLLTGETGAEGNAMHFWDLESLTEIAREGMTGQIDSFAVHPDGRKAARLGHASPHLRVWDLDQGQPSFANDLGLGRALKYTPDGKFLLSGIVGSNRLNSWDDAGKLAGSHTKDDSPAIMYVDVARDSRWAVYTAPWYLGDKAATIAFVEVPSGKLLKAHTYGDNGCWLIRLAPDDRHLYGGQEKGKLVVWEIGQDKSLKVLKEIAAHQGAVLGMALARDGKTLVTCGSDTLVQWAVPAGDKLQEWRLPGIPQDHRLNVLDFAPDNRHVAIGRTDGRVLILRLPLAR